MVKWDELSVMISEAKDIDTLKGFSDKLEALRILAKQSKESLETQNKIAEYRLRVERKKGSWLDENMPRGALPGSNNKNGERRGRVTLETVGVTRHESARARKLAAMKEDDFETFLRVCKDSGVEITLKGATSAAFSSSKRTKAEKRIQETKLKSLDSSFIHGESVEEILKLEDESIDCYIIDPPYGIDYLNDKTQPGVPRSFVEKSGFKQERIANDDLEGALSVLAESLAAVKPKLKDGAHVYVFGSWKTFSRFETIIRGHFDLKNVIVWHKNSTMGLGDLHGNYGEQYELIFFASKGKTTWMSEKRPGNVIYEPRMNTQRHPTEKPKELLKKLINVATVEGETVLDSFAGVASTLVAARETGRRYIGVELSEEYWRRGQRRLENNGKTD